jgi:hypothetical protein
MAPKAKMKTMKAMKQLAPSPGGLFRIFVQPVIGAPFWCFDVEAGDTIASLKAKIQRHYGARLPWNPADQRLVFAGTQLEDDRTLSDYNIKNKSLIELSWKAYIASGSGLRLARDSPPRDMQIFVKPGRFKIFTINVEVNDTIAHVKDKIEDKTEIPKAVIHGLTLWRGGQQCKTGNMESHRSLTSFGVQQGDTIKMRLSADDMVPRLEFFERDGQAKGGVL